MEENFTNTKSSTWWKNMILKKINKFLLKEEILVL